MHQKLKMELNKLWTGELASCLVFWVCYFLLTKKHTVQVIYPLVVLCFLLVQGSFYWLICLARLKTNKNKFAKIGVVYVWLKYINLYLLLFYIFVIYAGPVVPFKYYIIGVLIELFAVIEFINYFYYRLSYKKIEQLFLQLRTKNKKKSSLAKETQKYEFRKKKYPFLIGLFLFLVVFLYLENNAIQITKYSFNEKDFPIEFQGYRIVQVSDLHNKKFGFDGKGLVKETANCKPDIIVITGDLVDSKHTNIKGALDTVKALTEIAPVYYVTGNHEIWLPESERVRLQTGLRNLGVDILDNETSVIEKNNGKITMLGLADVNLIDETLRKMRNKIKTEGTILLAHEPQNIDYYSACDVDLVLSGHAHGGQIRIPFLGGFVAPDQGFFPAYSEGIITKNNTTMIVSRGLGNSIFPQRIFNRPELVLVEIVTDSQE